VYLIPWASVTAAVTAGTAINLSTNAAVHTLSEPGDLLPVTDAVLGYTDMGSGTQFQPVGAFGPNMLSGALADITLPDDPTYWGTVAGIGDKRVVVNLFLSALVVDLP
jgi:hypothetical protein